MLSVIYLGIFFSLRIYILLKRLEDKLKVSNLKIHYIYIYIYNIYIIYKYVIYMYIYIYIYMFLYIIHICIFRSGKSYYPQVFSKILLEILRSIFKSYI